MSLTKPTQKKLNMQQKHRGGGHHQKSKEYHKAYWPYLPILAIIVTGFFINSFWMKTGVLDYAIDTTANGLLASTNGERVNNGLGSLKLNASLNEAAQAKALDMVNRDYWSHNTPDGQEPWFFISNAGYKYQTAGENLAFGFPTSGDTIIAWMNSPGHRANILNNTYTEVGFGMANSASYQNYGNQTIVVAMYASPLPTLAADNTTSTQNSSPAVASNAIPPSSSPDTLMPANEPIPELAATDTENKPSTVAAATSTPQKVSRVEVAFTGVGPWSVGVAVLLVVTLGAMMIMKHGLAWRRVLIHGEQFVMHHKIADIIIVSVIVGALLLVQTVGFIQ